MFTDRGTYSELAIHPLVLAAAPTPVRDAWNEVQAAQQRLMDGRIELAHLNRAAEDAHTADLKAADDAVRAGKPVPPRTQHAAEEAVDGKKRAIPVLERMAHQSEVAFMRALRAHRDSIADTVAAQVNDAIDTVQQQAGHLSDALEEAQVLLGVWVWSQGDTSRQPRPVPLTVRGDGDVPVLAMLADARTRLEAARPAPETMPEPIPATPAKAEPAATADGLVMDQAGLRAAYP